MGSNINSYSEDEILYVTNNYKIRSNVSLGKQIGRSSGSVATKIYDLDLKRSEFDLSIIIKPYASKGYFKKGVLLSKSIRKKRADTLRKKWRSLAKKAAKGEFEGWYKNEIN